VVTLLVVAAIFVALGSLMAIRHEDSGMEAFCTSYRRATKMPTEPPPTRVSEIRDSPKMRAAMDALEEVYRLARRSGNARIVRAFAAQDAETSRAGTPRETPEQRAERIVDSFNTAIQAAVEECDAAGFPVVDHRLPKGGLPDRE
jgi:hypothetical protein